MEPVYGPVKGAILTAFKVLGWKMHVTGAEHIPTTGPAVIAANHVSYLDFIFVGFGARSRGRDVRFLAKKEVFDHKIAGPLMRGMKHVPVDRFGAAGTALELATDALRRGEVVGMFPEGTISRSFVPRSAKTGSARMALDAGAPLIPCSVWGGQRVLTKDRPKNVERNIDVLIEYGPPLEPRPGEDAEGLTRRLMEAIGELVDKQQRSYPVTPTPGNDWWLPAHLGGSAPTVDEADVLDARDKKERAARRRAERKTEATG